MTEKNMNIFDKAINDLQLFFQTYCEINKKEKKKTKRFENSKLKRSPNTGCTDFNRSTSEK